MKKSTFLGKSKNRLGYDSYIFEISLEDGNVTGWKDIRKRGTRDV